jgi:hypothetical protein
MSGVCNHQVWKSIAYDSSSSSSSDEKKKEKKKLIPSWTDPSYVHTYSLNHNLYVFVPLIFPS